MMKKAHPAGASAESSSRVMSARPRCERSGGRGLNEALGVFASSRRGGGVRWGLIVMKGSRTWGF